MTKMIMVVLAAVVLTALSHGLTVRAQETISMNEIERIDADSDFLADFKAEIAAENLIDQQLIDDLNAIAQQLNGTANEAVNNAEINAAEDGQ